MLEKRGDFQLGKSRTDDGSGQLARRAPKTRHDLVMEQRRKKAEELAKEAGVSQDSVDIDELLGDV